MFVWHIIYIHMYPTVNQLACYYTYKDTHI